MPKKVCSYGAIFIFVCLTLNGLCYGDGAESGKALGPRAGSDNVLRYALHTSKLGNMDPQFAQGSQEDTYTDLIFNGLLRYRPGDARQIEPDLARELPRFEILNNRQVWTISLRKGVFFHGSPGLPPHEMTARDVVFSLRKAGNPETCAYSGLYQDMAFEILDDYTLTITMEKPISPLFLFPRLTNVRSGVIFSQKVLEGQGYEHFLAHPVGTGPFQFKAYLPGERLELTANPRYFRGRPKLDGVTVYFIPDNKEREDAFMAGRMDVVIGTGKPGAIERMENIPGAKVDVYGPGYTGMFHLNTSIPPLNDIRVRRAIILALDRGAMMATTSPQLVTPVLGPMSPAFLPGGLESVLVDSLGLNIKPDIGKARELMAEAGMESGFSLEVPVSEKRLYQQLCKVLKEELAKINIQVELKTVTHSQYHKIIRENISPIVLYFTMRPDPDTYLRGFFHSDSIVKTGKTPNINFSNFKGVDKLLDSAVLEIDPAQQIRLWEQAQIKILSQMVVFPLFDVNSFTIRRDGVTFGHPLFATLAQYPQFNETTFLRP